MGQSHAADRRRRDIRTDCDQMAEVVDKEQDAKTPDLESYIAGHDAGYNAGLARGREDAVIEWQSPVALMVAEAQKLKLP